MIHFLPFTFFVLWLASFPMQGFLLAVEGVDVRLLFYPFVAVHALSLLTVSLYFRNLDIQKAARVAAPLTFLLSVCFPFSAGFSPLLMGLLGLCSVPVTLSSFERLKGAQNPVLNGGLALVSANLIQVLLLKLDLHQHIGITVVSLPLLMLLIKPAPFRKSLESGGVAGYVPFFFTFNLVAGLMYGMLGGEYAAKALFPGWEVVGYCFAVLLAVGVARLGLEALAVSGLLASLLAFSVVLMPFHRSIDFGMFLMMASSGFVDLLLVALLAPSANFVRSAGLSLGAVVSGILVGRVVFESLGSKTVYAGAANLVLAVCFAVFHLTEKKRRPAFADGESQQGDNGYREAGEPPGEGALPHGQHFDIVLPPGVRLSEQEVQTLRLIAEGKTYKETAVLLGIAESTVKTYIRRINEKTGAPNKSELLKLVVRSS